ncbi:glycosyl hydrolase [Phycicoccus sonneratiae]|uniref:GH26 domain-containing protein n=1 Tax=Phycicoccus sonneratiae TaxID=2807628 RepID=A0ABS2CK50_9MICO|nr:glycosyl hydrolase [Phycicoccus sonneraticus]MBM6400263.1 hypothetical protein [Phycicoccus sonneraticus]
MGISMSPCRRATQSLGVLALVTSLGLATAGSAAARPVPDPSSSIRVTSVTGTVVRKAVSTRNTIYFGAAGDVDALSAVSGETVSRHSYGNFQGSVPTGRMITVNASGIPWTSVTDAVPGTPMYTNIVRWAQTIKARPDRILLSFGHEPEVVKKAGLGTAAEYRAAYQHVVSIFRQQGVTNVTWVFQATAWAFRVDPASAGSAATWYPGDAYVDVVGGDAYNWNTCGLPGQGKDVPLSTIAGGILAFAKAHGKKASLPEFAATSSPGRAAWLTNGYAWLKSNSSYFVASYYFNRPPTNPDNADCVWWLNTPAEYASYTAIVKDTWTVQ